MWSKIWKLLPQYDCGFCSNPSCKTLARRIITDLQQPKDCGFLSKENLEKITGLLNEMKEYVEKTTFNEEKEGEVEFVKIEPCAEYGRVTLEGQLPKPRRSPFEDLYDMIDLGFLLEGATFLKNIRSSFSLGYALAQYEDSKVHIFKTGKIVMRRIENQEIAMQLFRNLSRILWGSVICKCGNSGIDCVGGGCFHCHDEVCPFLIWGLEKKKSYSTEPGYSLINKADKSDFNELFSEGKNRLDEMVKIFESALKTIEKEGEEKGKNRMIKAEIKESFWEKLQSLFNSLRDVSCQLLIEAKEDYGAVLGLILLGIGQNLKRANEGLLSLENDVNKDLLKSSSEIFLEGYKVFETGNKTKANNLESQFETFFNNWKKDYAKTKKDENLNGKILANLLKIAINGYFTSKMITRILPSG
ncbi:MAG: (Fe-S)-binding protein [Candidatus Hodarchaeota archaeon]